MPLTHAPLSLPSGRQAFRIDLSGSISVGDAHLLRDLTNPGGLYFGLPELVVLGDLPEIPLEFRAAVVKREGAARQVPLAVVFVGASAVVRTTARFVVRLEGVSHQFFESIEAATAWLDAAVASHPVETPTPAYGMPSVSPRG